MDDAAFKPRDRVGDAMARPLSVAIVGAGMGGLATAAALRRVRIDVMVYEQASQFARIGAGMGGLATAAALRRVGITVTVYEQAQQFTRLGAGIQIGCNAMKVLRKLGLEQRMRGGSFYPRSWNNRDWKTGDVKFDMIFGESAEHKFGAPYLLAHRGDLHAALASAVPDECINLGHKLVGMDETGDGVRLTFANGEHAEADAVIGGRRSFGRSRHPVRCFAGELYRPHRLPDDLSRRAAWRAKNR